MPVGRFAAFNLIILTAWASAMAEQPAKSASRRPVPHPDILQLPPDNSNSATVSADRADIEASTRQADALETSDASASAEAASSPGAAEQDKEILRRDDDRKSSALTQPGGVIGRNSNRFTVVSELWPLLAVLAVIGAAALAIKKFMPSQKLVAGSDVLRIVSRMPVGTKQQLLLVKLGRRLVLLGLSPDRINALTTIEEPNQVALLLGEAASGRPDSMASAFAATMNQESAAYGVDDSDMSDEDVAESTRGQVRGLLQKVRQMSGKGQ